MPLTLTLSAGALPPGTEKAAFARLSEAMLKWHDLQGNRAMTPNVIGAIHLIDEEHTFSGGHQAKVAFIEWKVPSFAFNTRKIQQAYVKEATDIIHEMSNGVLPKDMIWVNVVHAVDGAWGIGGRALTNQELGEAVSKG